MFAKFLLKPLPILLIAPKENTYLYLQDVPLLYLYILLTEKTFPPPPVPRSISAFVQAIDWLIDCFVKYFVSFLTCRYTDVYPPSYVFCTNAVSYVLTHRAGGWCEQKISPWLNYFTESHWAPFSRALCAKTGFWRDGFPGVYLLNWLAHFLSSVPAAFSPTKKCISFAVNINVKNLLCPPFWQKPF